jgi:fatty-acid desaturase
MALNSPLILNIICHMPQWGYKNFNIKDDSMNNWLMAIICVGDGWHNNHHAVPGSSNMGIKPWEIDPSYLLLKGLQKIGLVGTINDSLANEKPHPIPVAAVVGSGRASARPHRKREKPVSIIR